MLLNKDDGIRLHTAGVSTTTNLGAPPRLILAQHCSCLYLGITRAEAFLMASNASYPDICSMTFSRFIMRVFAYHLRISCSLYAFMLDLKLILVAED